MKVTANQDKTFNLSYAVHEPQSQLIKHGFASSIARKTELKAQMFRPESSGKRWRMKAEQELVKQVMFLGET